MTATKAEIATIRFPVNDIEGLMLEDGSFYVAFPQLVAINLLPPNRSVKQLESLYGMTFVSHRKLKTELHRQAVNAIDLLDLEKLLRRLDRMGNTYAQELVDAFVGLSMHQLFCDGFKIKFEEEERSKWLDARTSGIIDRVAMTDVIKDYVENNRNSLSPNEIKYMYSNVSDILNKALFGKTAKQLREERGCSRDEVRNTHNADSLRLISHIEFNIKRLILKQGMHPRLAAEQAVLEGVL